MSMSRMENNKLKKGAAIKSFTVNNIWTNIDDHIVTLDIELENGVVLKDAKMEITKKDILEMTEHQSEDVRDVIKIALGFYYEI
ncbi:ATP-dependent RNA circularization protein (DNA/RNA ligase family) [Peribacillus deserti]|uniref:ATP-dependent RNA circularization protein (DNA/RNA ligase family) n=1 Tax=Peribacillus deserti TaxID=673318 RepID=A0ABS2QFH9_9BACI|nr:hypothetical protein [Peribacillus deserti]MBM7691459.1 ATP-dependent RNA circularization protein (DNA/RNA ligase family) [Peribacillus deserti]